MNAEAAPAPPRLIRYLILGLPIGLIITSIIAMVIYFRLEERDRARSGRPVTRQPVDRAELASQVRMLGETIGERHAGKPDRLRMAAKFIVSSLGSANFGFKPTIETFASGGQEFSNLILELTGTSDSRWGEVIIVGAHYDSPAGSPGANANATGVAAVMSLARAFAGTAHERTLRFVFFANGEVSAPGRIDPSGAAQYADGLRRRGESVVAMIELGSLGAWHASPGTQQALAGASPPLPETASFLSFVAGPSGASLAQAAAAWFRESSTLPCHAAGVSADAQLPRGDWLAFAHAGIPALHVSDTGMLRNPRHGTANDRPDSIDEDRFAAAVQGLEGFLARLANPGPAGNP
jgi:hypothetical protein